MESSFHESWAKADARTGIVGPIDTFDTSGPRSSVVRSVSQSDGVAISASGYNSPVLRYFCLVVDAVWGRLAVVFSRHVPRPYFLLCCGIHLLWLIAGCDLPKRPPLKADRTATDAASTIPQAAEEELQAGLEAPGTAFHGDWESWDAYFIKDRQVGYSHTRATLTGSGPTADVRYELDSLLYVNQGPACLLQRVSQDSSETNDGRLLSFDATVRVGPATTRFAGSVVEAELRVETVRGASRTTRTMPWNPTFRGLVALEQSLRQRPMRTKGEERNLKLLLPGRYDLATARLRCFGLAAVPLLEGEPQELIEINCEIQTEDGPIALSTIWTDNEGEIARTHSPALQLIAYRTDRETAKAFAGNDQVAASIPVAGEIKEPQEAMLVGYRIQPTAAAIRADVALDFQPAPGQYVRAHDTGPLEVIVSRRKEIPGKGFRGAELVPTDADTASNPYIDVSHDEIRQFLAMAIKGDQLTAREAAIELTRSVHQIIAERTEINGFAKASSVAEYLLGDSTERAILLTALLRKRNIPARIVLGLKYLPGSPGRLVYHPWTIAYVDQTWMHLDPSEGGLAAADRLVLSTSDLSSGDEFEAIVPLLETMRMIQVEIAGQN